MAFPSNASANDVNIQRSNSPLFFSTDDIHVPEINDDDGEYNIEALLECIKEQSLDKLAVILGLLLKLQLVILIN